ncbi:NADPH_oxidoreductase [Hexamita inflata]|uniref:NADPH oxidoreductase n=1 Tax=Hexamita inflata TaxID=28002 RepID=A0AA86R8S0_9EUKA|nr:NADPH oxidoreductase [Hexamita inflata]
MGCTASAIKHPKTLVVLMHPNPDNSVRNKLIIDEISKLDNVTVRTISSTKIDVEEEKKVLLEYQRIVFQYPVQWYNVPGVGKEYLDQVLRKYNLKGKQLIVVNTTGAPKSSYKNPEVITELWGYTANYCGMILEKTFTLFVDDDVAKIAELKEAIDK